MADPGDVVTVDFIGATGRKRRPAVVLSSDLYHTLRPDVVVGILTTNLVAANTAADHILRDWRAAGLNTASAFRAYFGMARQSAVRRIGRLSDRDWQDVKNCVQKALA
jgi:mRNA interferase MazF